MADALIDVPAGSITRSAFAPGVFPVMIPAASITRSAYGPTVWPINVAKASISRNAKVPSVSLTATIAIPVASMERHFNTVVVGGFYNSTATSQFDITQNPHRFNITKDIITVSG